VYGVKNRGIRVQSRACIDMKSNKLVVDYINGFYGRILEPNGARVNC